MGKIKNFDNFINENSYIDEFKLLYDSAPQDLKNIVDATKDIEQSKEWHPEGDVYTHTKLVTNRLQNCYNDINLSLAGFFHDLGKVTTTDWNEEKQTWTAHGHEDDSSDIVHRFKDWILALGGDLKIIDFIVKNHMRIKYLDEFRLQEKIKFLNEPLFDYVVKFSTADFGGTELECKPPMDLSKIEQEIYEFNKREKEREIISSKFNGRIIMGLYPELKGEKLGDAISGFKKQFDDFTQYALAMDKDKILKDFEVFYNKNN
jgi:hypothetical protein